MQLLKDGITTSASNRKHLSSHNKDALKQGYTRSPKETSSASLTRKSKGSCTAGNDESNQRDLRRYGSDNSPAFCIKRSSRFEYMDPEDDEEPQEELTHMLSRRELEAIKEDAVNEVAMIIENINAELEENECKFVQYHSYKQGIMVAQQIRRGPNCWWEEAI